jgi:glutamate formiminotransferase/formiminotetrahydrofolate cyclodeaminase
MNLTNISVTPVHVAFDECVERAAARGVRVHGFRARRPRSR